jgi:hypothetical protein
MASGCAKGACSARFDAGCRARSCSTSRSRSRSAGTRPVTSRCCARSRGCSGRSRRTRRCRDRSPGWSPTPMMRWPRSARRAVARERVWSIAGVPVQDGRVVIDLDATLVTAHSDKQDATRTWKKTLRIPSLARVRRPRHRWGRGAGLRAAAPGQGGLEHRRRSRRRARLAYHRNADLQQLRPQPCEHIREPIRHDHETN